MHFKFILAISTVLNDCNFEHHSPYNYQPAFHGPEKDTARKLLDPDFL